MTKGFLVFGFAALLCGFNSAHADVTGGWAGTITASDSDGDTGSADDFSITINSDGSTVSFVEPNGYTYLDGVSFELKNGMLYLNHNMVGSFSSNRLEITLRDDIDQEIDHTVIEMNDDQTLDYYDHDLQVSASFYTDYHATLMTGATANVTTKQGRRGAAVRNTQSARTFVQSMKK
jgi:hypothetical protein